MVIKSTNQLKMMTNTNTHTFVCSLIFLISPTKEAEKATQHNVPGVGVSFRITKCDPQKCFNYSRQSRCFALVLMEGSHFSPFLVPEEIRALGAVKANERPANGWQMAF